MGTGLSGFLGSVVGQGGKGRGIDFKLAGASSLLGMIGPAAGAVGGTVLTVAGHGPLMAGTVGQEAHVTFSVCYSIAKSL